METMGCSSSSSVAAPAAVNPRTFALDAFNSSSDAARSAVALPPESVEGKDVEISMRANLNQLAVEIQNLPSAETSLDNYVDAVCGSEYFHQLCSTSHPMRKFSSGWITFYYPDNGQWKIGMDPNSGQVTMVTNEKLIGLSLAFSMGPMRSEVDSKGYADMFQQRLKSVFSNGFVTFNGGKSTYMRNISDPIEINIDGLTFYEWTQEMRVLIANGASMVGKQIEVHGMRNEPVADDSGRKTHFYGFNCNAVCPTVPMFAEIEPLFRKIFSSIHYSTAEECENILGAYWDKCGR